MPTASSIVPSKTSFDVGASQAIVAQAAQQAGVDPASAVAIMGNESGGNPNASSGQAYGLMQMTLGTARMIDPNATVQMLYDPDYNAQIASEYLAGLQSGQYLPGKSLPVESPSDLAAAYYSGGVYKDADGNYTTSRGAPGGPPTVQQYVNSFNARAGGAQAPPQPASAQSAQTSSGSSLGYSSADDADPVAALPVSGSLYSAAQIQTISAALDPSLIVDTHLTDAAWYDDPSILKATKPVDAIPEPVVFLIYFDTNDLPLSTKNTPKPHGPPIAVKLNCSLQSSEREMRHTVAKQQTRTGVLVTMWGMQPDMITGRGTTGLFMNLLGITDFLSLSSFDDSLKILLTEGVSLDDISASGLAGSAASIVVGANLGSDQLPVPAQSFRIAAKDAFMELLALFKNNAVVWYQNPNYTGYTTGSDQLGPDAWVPKTGSTTSENAGRFNDVRARGAVAMQFRNATYYGYFKSLSFSMDAADPYRWNFTFAFQVEKTVATVSLPTFARNVPTGLASA